MQWLHDFTDPVMTTHEDNADTDNNYNKAETVVKGPVIRSKVVTKPKVSLAAAQAALKDIEKELHGEAATEMPTTREAEKRKAAGRAAEPPVFRMPTSTLTLAKSNGDSTQQRFDHSERERDG